MKNNSKTKKSNIVQAVIAGLAVILIGLIIAMMSVVSDIQGTARVVNYAGLVRGKTQRIVKMEISRQPEDGMIADIDAFVGGLRNGDETLQLVRLDDEAFQNKMTELAEYFTLLKAEIQKVRDQGADATEIIPMSEHFFTICDEATGLAEAYSQRKATSLSSLEKYITMDIVMLLFLMGMELVKALRIAMQTRLLQKKVYLDNATGLPNKNKCEEILEDETPPAADIGVCSFDLNNLRRINNSMGHEAGDAYIRRFAICLRKAMPATHFVGRAGGDEFLAVTHGLDEAGMKTCLSEVRRQMAEESKAHPATPLSYAVGYALAADHPGSVMRDLFIQADKNMYINKNHVKREEAAAERKLDYQLLKLVNRHGHNFSACLYCDAAMDTYRTIRGGDTFFLAADGSYTGAVEQLAAEQVSKEERNHIRESLQLTELAQHMKQADDVLAFSYKPCEGAQYNRLTVIPVDWDEEGHLHHFILAFQMIRQSSHAELDAKEQLTLYYEQLKQSILENDSYVDALLDMADYIYTVNLTKDVLERNIPLSGKRYSHEDIFLEYPLPCSYREYCREYIKKVTKETLGSYRLTATPEALLKRFAAGEKHLTVEYCLQDNDGTIRWIQKTVLMIQTVVYDEETRQEMPMVNAIVLLHDTSDSHARDEQEHARLQAAFDEMRNANRTKTEFLSRMSHDIRTPLNGIIGLLQVDEDHFQNQALVLENHKKMRVAANHLLSLINDVLEMSKLEEGKIVFTKERISLDSLMRDIEIIIIDRATRAGLSWNYPKEKLALASPWIYGSPLHLRQIFLNIYGNCIKYNKPHGSISTTVDVLEETGARCLCRWTISDTGIGMTKEYLAHIFEPFTQERQDARSVYHGTGLGMTIVKELIEQMGGTIEIASEEGQGSTFTITLPFNHAPSPQPAAPKETEKHSIQGLHLLVVEDNDLNAEIADMLLTDKGAQVTVVHDGKQAVDLFNEKPAGTFDAILMDIMMPVMDGITATKTIRALSRPDAKTIPILAMTANAFAEDAKKCLAAGMNAHLAKPLDIGKVVEAIGKWVTGD